MNRFVLGLLIGCPLVLPVHAQDPELLMSGRVLPVFDPSRTGFAPGVQLAMVHTSRRADLPKAWNADAFLAEWCARNPHKVTRSWLGFGLLVKRDVQPAPGSRIISPGIQVATHLRTGERSFLSAGIGAHWVDRMTTAPDGAWASQYMNGLYDPSIASGEVTGTFRSQVVEGSAGLSWTLKQEEESALRRERELLVVGVSLDHLGQLVLRNEGDQPETRPWRTMAYVQGELPMPWNNGYLSGEVIGLLQGPFHSFRVNAYVGRHLLNSIRREGGPLPLGYRAGIGYRYRDGLLLSALLDLQRLSFGLAYELPAFRSVDLPTGMRSVEVIAQLRLSE